MKVTLEGISKSFGNKEILRDISFTIPYGCRTALIGQSGAGKSTLGSLVRRDTSPSKGEVFIDSYKLSELRLNSLLPYMGVILQRPEVITGIVRENILFGVQDEETITDEEIWNVIDTISPSMRKRFNSKGLDTLVGKHGLQLSGGEQQRLCVMRALIKKPLFLIIDEATSSLDSETEIIAQQGIDSALEQGISALVIAHRFSTLRNCNQFVVLKKLDDCEDDEPQIEAIANSMKELMDVSPTFRKLANFQGFTP